MSFDFNAKLSYISLIVLHGIILILGFVILISSYFDEDFVPAVISQVFGIFAIITSGFIFMSILSLFLLFRSEEEKVSYQPTRLKIYNIIQITILIIIFLYVLLLFMMGIASMNGIIMLVALITVIPAIYLFHLSFSYPWRI